MAVEFLGCRASSEADPASEEAEGTGPQRSPVGGIRI